MFCNNCVPTMLLAIHTIYGLKSDVFPSDLRILYVLMYLVIAQELCLS